MQQHARRFCVVLIWAVSVAVSLAAPPSALQVGAARVDITPAADAALPMGGYGARTQGFQRIHDHIYVRAIVLSDGANQAVLLAWELIAMPTRVWEDLSQRIAKELGIPAENQLLAGVHDHSAPTLAGTFGRPPAPGATPAAAPPGRRLPRAPSPTPPRLRTTPSRPYGRPRQTSSRRSSESERAGLT